MQNAFLTYEHLLVAFYILPQQPSLLTDTDVEYSTYCHCGRCGSLLEFLDRHLALSVDSEQALANLTFSSLPHIRKRSCHIILIISLLRSQHWSAEWRWYGKEARVRHRQADPQTQVQWHWTSRGGGWQLSLSLYWVERVEVEHVEVEDVEITFLKVDSVRTTAEENINTLLENFMGINDAELGKTKYLCHWF